MQLILLRLLLAFLRLLRGRTQHSEFLGLLPYEEFLIVVLLLKHFKLAPHVVQLRLKSVVAAVRGLAGLWRMSSFLRKVLLQEGNRSLQTVDGIDGLAV